MAETTKRGVEFRDNNGKIYRVLDTPVLPTDHDRQLRIEALRAASRVVAGIYAGDDDVVENHSKTKMSAEKATVQIAEQFACWLENG